MIMYGTIKKLWNLVSRQKEASKSPQDVATRIRSHSEEILKSWMALVRLEVPGAANLPDDPLRNGLHKFLGKLADVVSTTAESEHGERSSIETLEGSLDHGTARARQPAYTLDQVITEYRILRSVLFATLEATGELIPRERQKLLESIDYGIMAAAVQFSAALGFKKARAADLETRGLKLQLSEFRKERDDARTRSDELARATAELQREREMRERFVSALTHDLRNPLTAALMRLELIKRQAGHLPSVITLSSQAVRDIERANGMIGDLLDANRIRAGQRLALHIIENDVVSLIKKTIEELVVVHGDRFTFRAPESLKAFVDPAGVRRIVENLCANAVKYGDLIAPVTVSLRAQGSELTFSVHNWGPALSPKDQSSLFDQFRRTDTASKSGKKGWGLGLALVKGMAEAHGGSVRVASAEGKGTTFSVVLPCDARKFQGAA